MNKLWTQVTSHEQVINKPWTICEKIVKRCKQVMNKWKNVESHGQEVCKLNSNYEQNKKKSWTSQGWVMLKE